MSTKWTPGPWTASIGTLTRVNTNAGACIAGIHRIGFFNGKLVQGEKEANARLIAAAPEYDSLVGDIIAEIKKYHPTFDAKLFVRAERLRAKARGEA